LAENEKPLLRELNNHVVPKWAASWKQLGGLLNIEEHLIRIIEQDHPNDCEGCCSKMLQEWLDMNSNATWEILVNALDKVVDDMTGLLCV